MIVCLLLAVAACEGCQTRIGGSGIGSNLVPVKQNPDGTWLFVESDQVAKYREDEKAKQDAAKAASQE